MTKEIRRTIAMINPSQRTQHTRIKMALSMICDMLDDLTGAKQAAKPEVKKVEVKK